MDKLETERLDLARWAVRRWATFPVDADPRPVVLAQPVITSERGFTSGEAKDAWLDGRYEWAVEVPEGVRVRAQRSADQHRQEPAEQPLTITHAGRDEHEFLTDRGPLTLPAYWLQGPSIVGPLWVLDPELDYWEPPEGAGGPAPLATSLGQPLMSTPFYPVEAEADSPSITIPWMGSRSADYGVELIETATAISAVAINETERSGAPGWHVAMGHIRRIPARLAEPTGSRVFVDLRGEAMHVMSPSARAMAAVE